MFDRMSVFWRHVVLFGGGALLLLGVYLLYQNMTAVMFGGVLLVLAHLAAVAVVFFLGRGILGRLVQKFHGTETNHPNPHSNSHPHGHPH